MASNSGAQVMVKVGFDDSGREAFLAGNERAFKRSSERIAAHERQARRGSSFSGGQNAAYRVGMVSQQAQDVAVSLQMGMSASRVIAQQGSQIASIFGPKGMVIGGVIAIGAAITEWVLKTKEAEKAAKEYADYLNRGEGYKARAREASENIAVERARAASGSNVADALKSEIELREKNLKLIIAAREIRKQRGNLEPFESPAGRGRTLREILEFAETKKARVDLFNIKNTQYNLELQKIEKEIADNNELAKIKADARTKEIAAQQSMFAMEKRIQSNLLDFSATHTEREIEDERRILAFKIESRNIANDASLTFEQKAERMELARILSTAQARDISRQRKKQDDEKANKDESAALDLRRKESERHESEMAKASEETAKNNAQYDNLGKSAAENLLDINKQISQLQSQKNLSISEEFERDLKVSKLKLEQHSAEKTANDELLNNASRMASITMKQDATRLDILKAEKELLDKKIAFTPSEIALINAQKQKLDEDIRKQQLDGLIAAGGAGMGIVAQQRAQDKAQERALKRAEGNLGLGQIKRGMSGEIIGGVNLDPNSGKVGERVGPEEIARRQKLLGLIGKKDGLPIEATALFTPKQIKDLSDGIALAILATTTK